MKNLILIAMLSMALFSLPSCSEGSIIPVAICDYGTDICQTLEFLCDMSASNKLDSLDTHYLQRQLAEIDLQVKRLKTETIARSNK